jgi:2-succinyl-6-hydroxy-2,4-cyclohexadiene-1-carboxylate synthase
MRLTVADGTQFNVEVFGPIHSRTQPLVLLHGFTGSVASWRPHLEAFGQHHKLVMIDMLGHGESDCPANPLRYRMEYCLDDLIELFDQLQLNTVTLLGYSMGGRVALSFAVAHSDRVNKLILESASPGLADVAEREARVANDEVLAIRIEREGLEAFVNYWERSPLFASQARLPGSVRVELRTQRLRANPKGLANSLRGLGVGAQPSLWARLNEIRMPTLLIAGMLDQKFTATAQMMADAIPESSLVIVPEAGHTVHLEQPQTFDRLVLDWLLAMGN